MSHPALNRPERKVDGPHPLNTTHDQRAKWLSEQLQKVNPIKKQPDFDILWDLYLLCFDRDEADRKAQGESIRYRGMDVPEG